MKSLRPHMTMNTTIYDTPSYSDINVIGLNTGVVKIQKLSKSNSSILKQTFSS